MPRKRSKPNRSKRKERSENGAGSEDEERDEAVPLMERPEWEAAEFCYLQLISGAMIPLSGFEPTPKEKLKTLNEIVDSFAAYYPAHLALGNTHMAVGQIEDAAASYMRGLEVLAEHFPYDDYYDTAVEVAEMLEQRFQFDLAIAIYQRLLDHDKTPDKDRSRVHDSLGHCYALGGDHTAAVAALEHAIELDEKNGKRWSNLGWVYLLRGDLAAAKGAIERALELDPEDGYAKGNWEIYTYLAQNEKAQNYEDYLLKPLETSELAAALEDEEYNRYHTMVVQYNRDLLEGFSLHLTMEREGSATERYDRYFALQYLFRDIEKGYEEDYFQYDDIELVTRNFRRIFVRLIAGTSDIDDEVFDQALEGLLEFYRYLAAHDVVPREELEELEAEAAVETQTEMLRRMMHNYNKRVRADPHCTAERRAEVRDALFGDDIYHPIF